MVTLWALHVCFTLKSACKGLVQVFSLAYQSLLQYLTSCKVCAHTELQIQIWHLRTHAQIMQIAVPPVSVITKVFCGRMLSYVESCGSGWNTTRAPLFLCFCHGRSPAQSSHQTYRKYSCTVSMHMHMQGSQCLRCSSSHVLVISAMPFFHPRSQILTHCCLNHNGSLLFLPRPHLSVRIGRYSMLSSAGCSNRPDWHDTARVAHARTYTHAHMHTTTHWGHS